MSSDSRIKTSKDWTDSELQDEFRKLVADWKERSGYMSNTVQMSLLKPYQRIIGLGPRMIPILLEELRREPDHWFWALESLTGVDPVSRRNAAISRRCRHVGLSGDSGEG